MRAVAVTRCCRFCLALLFSIEILQRLRGQSKLDAVAESVWDIVSRSRIFRHDSFEPGLVAVSFAAWHLLFYVADTRFDRLLQHWRIQSSSDMRHWKFEGGKRLRGEFLAVVAVYFVPILAFDQCHPRRKLPERAPSAFRLVTEVLTALLLYDALFFLVHLALHKVPWLYANCHALHHTKSVQRASETLRLDPAEVVLDTMCSIAALNITKAHPLSRAVYNPLITYLITELHSGYNFPWMLQNVLPGIWAGSLRHDQHHQLGKRYYQKFFTYLDNLYESICRQDNFSKKSV